MPDDFLEAARIDGLNEFTIWWKIAMPLVTPALSALAIFTFLGNWTAFFWPLIVTTSAELYTLPVGLSSFAVEQSIQWEKIMTGASIATLPDPHHLPVPPALHRPRRDAGRTQRLKPMTAGTFNDTSVFPDPVYKETVLRPLFDGAKDHHVEGFRLIDRAHLVMLQRRASSPSSRRGPSPRLWNPSTASSMSAH